MANTIKHRLKWAVEFVNIEKLIVSSSCNHHFQTFHLRLRSLPGLRRQFSVLGGKVIENSNIFL